MKLPNKTGTVYKLSGKRRKPWIARVYDGKDEYGLRKYKTLGYYPTKTEARRELLAFNSNPYDIDAKRATFEEVFNLVREQKAKDLAPSTIKSNFDNMYKKFFYSLKGYRFADLRPLNYQIIFDEAGKTRKTTYLRKALSLLSNMYKYALMNDIVSTDYSKGIVIRGQQTEAQDYFTIEELQRMITLMGSVEDADVIVMMCLTGLRPSEVIELSKSTIDLEKRIITNVGVKTSAGKQKRVPVARVILPYLKKRCEDADSYLFTINGNQMTYKQFYDNVYNPVFERMDIPYKSPKACRHTFANITYKKLDDKTRKSIIGHSRIDTTNNIYTDIEDRQLVEYFDNAVKV